MRRRAGGSLAVLSVVLFLVACTELAPRVEGVRGPAAPLWTSFEVSGRIAVRSEDDAFSGNFAWRHSPDADSIDLLSPLGQTAARLSRDAAGIRFQSGDGHSLQAPDWEALTQRALGWSLPVAGLSYWMQGVPAPNTGHKSNNDEANRLQELHQDGWTIRYRDYGAQGKPTRMELSYGALQIRLAIDSWKLAQRESMQRRS